MEIQSDGAGFLIGERRLKDLATGVGQVQGDTSEILQLLRDMLQGESRQRQSHYQRISEMAQSINTFTRAKTPAVLVTLNTGASKTTTKATGKNFTFNTASTAVSTSDSRLTPRISAISSDSPTKEIKGRVSGGGVKVSSGPVAGERDSQGRFVSSAQGINDKTLTDSIKQGFNLSNIGSAPDVSGVDPTVDAVQELTTLFSPARRAFGLMGRGALWLYRKGKPKRSEAIPDAQKKHNDEVERSNYEERKVLRKILDAINRSGVNGKGLLGGLASLLGAGAAGNRGRKGRDGKPAPAGDKDNKKKTPPVVAAPGKDKTKTPSKVGKFGKLFSRVPFLGALVGAGMMASDWGEQDNGGKGAGIGGLVGAGVGGTVGALAGPVGSIAGGTIGGMLGERVGQTVGDWTNSLKKGDIGGAIVSRWDNTLDGINKFISQSWNKMGLGFGLGMMGKMGMGGGMMMASFRRPGFGGSGGYGNGAADNGSTTQARNRKEEQQNQMDVYDSMIGAGFSKSQAQALTAEVGRENGYQSKYLYGAHQDAANGKTNIGMISWQGDRAKRLYKSMSDQGFIKDGKMIQSKQSLLAQAKFMRQEIETDKSYAATNKMFKENPNADPETYAKTLGKNYIGWAYGQDRLSSGKSFDWQGHNAVRRGQLKEIQNKTDGPRVEQRKPAPQQSTNGNGVKPIFVNTAKPATSAKSLYVSNSPKPKQAAEYQFPKIIQKENSTTRQSAPMMASNHNAISQNVADREITHAVTGGLGMRAVIA